MSNRDAMQVCLNGHFITANYHKYPEHSQNACTECGAKTITTCLSCNAEIRGSFDLSFYNYGQKDVPKYCHECGAPYPWTSKRLEAIKMLLDEDEHLDQEAKDRAIEAIPDLVSDTPSTPLAEARWKKLLMKTSKVVGEGIKTILIEVASEAAKKSLGLG